MSGVDEGAKRAFDLILAGLLLLITSPLWALIALAIRLTSPGPVFYTSRRVGEDGRPFRMYKFRTMRADAERIGPSISYADDRRVTRLGRLLRLTKLDELPQLVNVLRGDMSLVGPRPELEEYVSGYDERQKQVLRVRPGITGPSQIEYRHEQRLLPANRTEEHYREHVLPQKLESDLEYVRHRTFWGDIKLLIATGTHLFKR